ncbi:uncharacterized protein MONBRDRAFT_5799 [Monosiga brevicollis MX1]|uniref:Protein-serine/threonine phosphatase n=1 Tax=Monosiga brevicollis TaxID=81824 RepID=A9USH9_MONBE|nr:uncharacterized protein MONBRDRAFT_5799 [Monosiga brevicollis MX1]EDQ92103.1 predicted protein [Monosiga brevicollis MX1]|eukprot:XP_001743389.1 hypothetical protein [Monosiga brevicollis MX1]
MATSQSPRGSSLSGLNRRTTISSPHAGLKQRTASRMFSVMRHGPRRTLSIATASAHAAAKELPMYVLQRHREGGGGLFTYNTTRTTAVAGDLPFARLDSITAARDPRQGRGGGISAAEAASALRRQRQLKKQSASPTSSPASTAPTNAPSNEDSGMAEVEQVLELAASLLNEEDDCVLACKLHQLDSDMETASDKRFFLALIRHSENQACILCLSRQAETPAEPIKDGDHAFHVDHVVPIGRQSNFKLHGDGTFTFNNILDPHQTNEDDNSEPSTPRPFEERSEDEWRRLLLPEIKKIIAASDLDTLTSKEVRLALELKFGRTLKQFKGYIDEQMIVAFGQMAPPSPISDLIFLGTEWNACNLEELRENGCSHILNVTEEVPSYFEQDFEYLRISLPDEETENLLQHWNRTFDFIELARANDSRVLVHCKMGVSRSASTVMAYLMRFHGYVSTYHPHRCRLDVILKLSLMLLRFRNDGPPPRC